MTAPTLPIRFDDQWLDAGSAILTRHDRSARYADGLFETIRVHDRRARHVARHLARLADGAAALRLDFPSALDARSIDEFVDRSAVAEGAARIRLWRRSSGFGYRPASTASHLLIEIDPLVEDDTAREAIVSTLRRIPPVCLPTAIKSSQCLGSVMALAEAGEAREALMLSIDGHLACFASGNLFWREGGVILTPALSTGCLAGIARGLLLERAGAIEVVAEPSRLRAADAVAMTNSIRGAVAIRSIDGIGNFPGSGRWASSLRPLLLDPEGA